MITLESNNLMNSALAMQEALRHAAVEVRKAAPIVKVDDRTIGSGVSGPVTCPCSTRFSPQPGAASRAA